MHEKTRKKYIKKKGNTGQLLAAFIFFFSHFSRFYFYIFRVLFLVSFVFFPRLFSCFHNPRGLFHVAVLILNLIERPLLSLALSTNFHFFQDFICRGFDFISI